MNNFFSQLKKEAEGIRLSHTERDAMRRALEYAMQSSGLVKSPIQIVPSPYLFIHQRLVSSLALVLVVILVGGTTAYAAEAAIPGDILYTVKVNLNESVRETLARGAEAKAEWYEEAANRRMQEAEALAARGTLTADVKVALEERFESHAEALEENIALVEEKDPVIAAEISNRFESSVLAHSAIVARLGDGGGNDTSRRESIQFAEKLKARGGRLAYAARTESVKAERMESGDITLMAVAEAPEGTSTVSASIVIRDSGEDAVLARLELNASTTLEEAQSKLNALEATLDATTSARVNAQIEKIRGLIAKFKKDRTEGFGEKIRVQKLLHDASTVNAFLEAQGKFKSHLLLPAPGVSENGEGDEEDSEEGERSSEGSVPVEVPIQVSF